jgi:excisionase family DNA binding protein
MMPDKYQPPDGFLTLRQAQERLSVSKTKVWQLARDGRLPVHTDPRDGRVKLVRVADVERLMQPQPVPTCQPPASALP